MNASARPVTLAASLMCADFSKLDVQLDELTGLVSRLHLDFGDGVFVPSVILGPEVFALLAHREDFELEAHLMVCRPELHVSRFGARTQVTIVHAEAVEDPFGCFECIRRTGSRVGLAINPDTPVSAVERLLPFVSQLLVMTVQPGFAGGTFIPATVEKVRQARQLAVDNDRTLDIEVDGGVNESTISRLAGAGANVFVGGSTGLFVKGDLRGAASRMFASACAAQRTICGRVSPAPRW